MNHNPVGWFEIYVQDMARARKAVADYGLAIRLTQCQQFDTNLGGDYRWCPVTKTDRRG